MESYGLVLVLVIVKDNINKRSVIAVVPGSNSASGPVVPEQLWQTCDFHPSAEPHTWYLAFRLGLLG